MFLTKSINNTNQINTLNMVDGNIADDLNVSDEINGTHLRITGSSNLQNYPTIVNWNNSYLNNPNQLVSKNYVDSFLNAVGKITTGNNWDGTNVFKMVSVSGTGSSLSIPSVLTASSSGGAIFTSIPKTDTDRLSEITDPYQFATKAYVDSVGGGTSSIADGSLTIAKTSGLQTALDSKLSSIADGSLTIAKTLNLQSTLDSKLSSIANSSITDAMLASTFIKPSTAPTLTGTNFSSIPTSAISSGNLSLLNLILSQNLTAGSISEKITTIAHNGTVNSYTLDYSTNTAVYYLTTNPPTGNFTIRLNNCGTDLTKSINFAVIYPTTLKYYCNSISAYSDTSTSISLASSPLFLGGTPNLTSSTVIIQTFGLIRNVNSTNYILSSVSPFF